ncbi:MAG: hypothetical protein HKN11_14490 [Rhizobiales bacterium]|nr:hypothetical protein [Hyphomicrobiales bacterium]
MTVWVFTQTSMLFAHTGSGDHGAHAHPASAHQHGDHFHAAGLASGSEQAGNIGAEHSSTEPDMASMDCCGSTCTVDAQIMTCPLGSQLVRSFSDKKIAALTAVEQASPNPPPNTTI